MNTIKTLKSYALYTLLTVSGFAIWYLGTAFVVMDLNPVNWSEATRLLAVTEGSITAIGIVSITHLTRSKKN